jgi:hypothetical protein
MWQYFVFLSGRKAVASYRRVSGQDRRKQSTCKISILNPIENAIQFTRPKKNSLVNHYTASENFSLNWAVAIQPFYGKLVATRSPSGRSAEIIGNLTKGLSARKGAKNDERNKIG